MLKRRKIERTFCWLQKGHDTNGILYLTFHRTGWSYKGVSAFKWGVDAPMVKSYSRDTEPTRSVSCQSLNKNTILEPKSRLQDESQRPIGHEVLLRRVHIVDVSYMPSRLGSLFVYCYTLQQLLEWPVQ